MHHGRQKSVGEEEQDLRWIESLGFNVASYCSHGVETRLSFNFLSFATIRDLFVRPNFVARLDEGVAIVVSWAAGGGGGEGK